MSVYVYVCKCVVLCVSIFQRECTHLFAQIFFFLSMQFLEV